MDVAGFRFVICRLWPFSVVAVSCVFVLRCANLCVRPFLVGCLMMCVMCVCGWCGFPLSDLACVFVFCVIGSSALWCYCVVHCLLGSSFKKKHQHRNQTHKTTKTAETHNSFKSSKGNHTKRTSTRRHIQQTNSKHTKQTTRCKRKHKKQRHIKHRQDK